MSYKPRRVFEGIQGIFDCFTEYWNVPSSRLTVFETAVCVFLLNSFEASFVLQVILHPAIDYMV